MEGEIRNELTWSFSRKRAFDTCRRQYLHRYYTSWGGWDRSAPSRSQLAYRLSKIQSLNEYTGLRVHKIIGGLIWNLKQGDDLTTDEQIIHAACDRDFKESSDRMWLNNPKRSHNFFEDYYCGGLSDARKEETKKRIVSSVRNFISSPTAAKLKSFSGQIEWLCIDTPNAFPSFLLDGMKLFALPDLAIRLAGKVYIFDWKTGSTAGTFVDQISCYALYAVTELGSPVQDVYGYVVGLSPDFTQQSFRYTEESLQSAAISIKQSYQDMLDLVGPRNRANEKDFPKTDDERTCKLCHFAEMCE